MDHPDSLLRLSELELIDRHHRMVDPRIKAARFPTTKSLDTFDFLAIPSFNKPLVLELARCEYIDRNENAIAVGNSGTGKTHVALGLGLAACQRGLSSQDCPRRRVEPPEASLVLLLTPGPCCLETPRRQGRLRCSTSPGFFAIRARPAWHRLSQES